MSWHRWREPPNATTDSTSLVQSNPVNLNNGTALHYVAFNGNQELLPILFDYGADKSIVKVARWIVCVHESRSIDAWLIVLVVVVPFSSAGLAHAAVPRANSLPLPLFVS